MGLWQWIGLATLLLLSALALSNATLPTASPQPAELGAEQAALLAEAVRLRSVLGETVWPGWGEATIPLLVYNERYAFLSAYPGAPSPGWTAVPWGTAQGGPWEAVGDSNVAGAPLYRLDLPPGGVTPQAFTVRVESHWVASLPTRVWMRIDFANQLRAQLPAPLDLVFPYRLLLGAFVGGADRYLFALLHESFHAFQGLRAPERLAAAERAVGRVQGAYPWDEPAQRRGRQAEADALLDGLKAASKREVAAAARRFLALRAQRRASFEGRPDWVEYERGREWLEGLAKYVELAAWKTVANTESYAPVAELNGMDAFSGYRGFERRWSGELSTLAVQGAAAGDSRWYYSGMAQAFLLDRLRPGWKAGALEGDAALEDLLREALADFKTKEP